ncbi:MAG: putative enzyme related to lactoylglutathione lyase [Planctomycetota bacterium]|jgi:predicted enzyme related to lactoylglutathione lyase
MSQRRVDKSISSIELSCTDMQATKPFFSSAFDWEWKDWGPDY